MAKTIEDYFMLSLQLTYNPSMNVEEWINHSRAQAERLMTAAQGVAAALQSIGATGAPAAAPVPERIAGNRFGPAFNGWDEVALMQVLLTAQQVVITREQGGNEEQQGAAEEQLMRAVEELGKSPRGTKKA